MTGVSIQATNLVQKDGYPIITPPAFTGSYADVNLGCNPANPEWFTWYCFCN
jgi:hypothetical protein